MKRQGLWAHITSATCVLWLFAAGCAAAGSTSTPENEGAEESRAEQPEKSKLGLLSIRRGFQTNIIADTVESSGPAARPPPEIFEVVHYPSPAGDLVAYLTPDPEDGEQHPAIIWAHGGFGGIGEAQWMRDDLTRAFRDAGLIVMVPSWRGENDNPGRFEMFYGEVEDAVAAIDYVRALPYVDAERVYMAGHSTGGTLTLLTVEATNKLRAAFSLGGAPDIELLLDDGRGYGNTPFPVEDGAEARFRSARRFVNLIETPTYYMEGSHSPYYVWAAESMEEQARELDIEFYSFVVDGGNHFNVLAPLNELIAQQIAADIESEPSLDLDQEAVQRAFDSHYDREASWNTTNGHYQVQACEQGDVEMCRMAGWFYYSESFGRHDAEKGWRLLVRSCEGGGGLCGLLGIELFHRAEGDEDFARARQWLDAGCDEEWSRRGESCMYYGDMLQRGLGGPIDHAAARAALERGCLDEEHGGACHLFGISHAAGIGAEVNQQRAARLYLRGCELGYTRACGDAAFRLSTGWGIDRDPDRAFSLAKEACRERTSFYPCRILATFYRDGRGTSADPERAFELFKIVCRAPSGYSCESAGRLLLEDPKLADASAQAFFEKAAAAYRPKCHEYNDGRRCGRLAGLYESGYGVPEDAERAEQLRKRACRYDPRECSDATTDTDQEP